MADIAKRLRDWLDYEPVKMFGGVILKDIGEAADEIERLRAALTKCAAPFDTGPTTLGMAPHIIRTEFQRRMNIAAFAISSGQNVEK